MCARWPRRDATLVTIVPPSGYAEEMKAAAEPLLRLPPLLPPLLRLLPAAAPTGAPGAAPGRPAAGGPLPPPKEVRRPQGRARMLLLVGLGNPGTRYAGNRHNIGFMAVEAIARRHGSPPWRRRFQGVADGRAARRRESAAAAARHLHERVRAARSPRPRISTRSTPDDIVVFHDEIDLPPAKVRVKTGGGIAGHNGLRSISAHVGNDYRRVRIGVGHPGVKELVHDYVLGDFAKSERPGSRRCATSSPTMPGCWPRATTRASRTRCISPCRPRGSTSQRNPTSRTPRLETVATG